MPTAVKVLLAIAALVVAVVVILVVAVVVILVVAARLAGYSTTMDLVRYLLGYLQYIWNERLFA
ncbi:hypothetical protein LJC04_01000 [Ruminococcaceae bacterium OttesenSCG-928-O06]|nr:hypothetical protein [Ruminococcaceae bacterium OttesenSCG-928-O06]